MRDLNSPCNVSDDFTEQTFEPCIREGVSRFGRSESRKSGVEKLCEDHRRLRG